MTAGIELALAVLAALEGPDAARALQIRIEYDPQPPFDTGSPSKASPAIRALSDEMIARVDDARRHLWPQGRT